MLSKSFKLILICSSLIFTLGLFSCGEDPIRGSSVITTEERSFGDFNKVSVSDAINVNITRGSEQRVVVRANDNVISRIITELNQDRLDIFLSSGSFKNVTLEVDVTLPTLTELRASDAVNVTVQDIQQSGNLTVRGSDAANISMDGSIDDLTLNLSDGTKYQGFNLTAQNCIVSLSDAADGSIFCSTLLQGSLQDAARLRYKGNPSIQVSTSDAASVINDN